MAAVSKIWGVFPALAHLFSTTRLGAGTVMDPISQIRKLRPRRKKALARDHQAGKRQGG